MSPTEAVHALHDSPAVAVLVAVAVLLIAYALLRRLRRTLAGTPAAVLAAGLGALLCTAYSGDTSWAFARDHLNMHGLGERAVMFAAGEVALFSMALMARQNLRTIGAPGAPGVLVWVITGVQVIPAYSESGIIAGTVRAFVGPILAAVLWHLAMGIELRHARPDLNPQSLPAILLREVRERLLARLGLSRRERDAVQIRRERWTGIATRRAARLADLAGSGAGAARIARARRRLSVAVDRTDAGALPDQREALLGRLGAYRNAGQLAFVALPSPWGDLLPEPPEVTSSDAQAATARPRPGTRRLRHRRRIFSREIGYREAVRREAGSATAADSGEVVIPKTVITPSDLRRKARQLNREAVSSTGKAVTIGALRSALGVSRRDAAALRRDVAGVR